MALLTREKFRKLAHGLVDLYINRLPETGFEMDYWKWLTHLFSGHYSQAEKTIKEEGSGSDERAS